MRAWQRDIARHEQVLARRDGTEEERRISRQWLQGMDGYLQQIYERNDIRRPRGLRVGTVAARARESVVHLDELWP
ncbi:MAG: hypothetical protein KJN97_00890 [Deltaproteobacteria bacterium]|nr:hypothetical protein [Deltaproteobacteria bacterium]